MEEESVMNMEYVRMVTSLMIGDFLLVIITSGKCGKSLMN